MEEEAQIGLGPLLTLEPAARDRDHFSSAERCFANRPRNIFFSQALRVSRDAVLRIVANYISVGERTRGRYFARADHSVSKRQDETARYTEAGVRRVSRATCVLNQDHSEKLGGVETRPSFSGCETRPRSKEGLEKGKKGRRRKEVSRFPVEF